MRGSSYVFDIDPTLLIMLYCYSLVSVVSFLQLKKGFIVNDYSVC